MAYTTARLIQKDPPRPDGREEVTIEFTGDAGESPIHRQYRVQDFDTLQALRQRIIGDVAALGTRKSVAAALVVGATLSLAPIVPVPPVPTAVEVWLGKARRLARAEAIKLTGAAVVDIAALRADVEVTYASGFLADL